MSGDGKQLDVAAAGALLLMTTAPSDRALAGWQPSPGPQAGVEETALWLGFWACELTAGEDEDQWAF